MNAPNYHVAFKAGLAAVALAMTSGLAHAQTASAQILADGGPTHHHALHGQNPILAKYKGLFPRRVQIVVDDTDEVFTVLNEGPRFEVASGEYGAPNLTLEIANEAIEQIYDAVKSGSMPEGIPRIDMAILYAEHGEVNPDNPQAKDKASGPGPKLDKRSKFLVKFIEVKDKGIKFMGKAGAAKAAGKKLSTLYYGLISKLAFKKGDKLSEKTAKYLLGELGQDLDEGRMAITPGAWWSTFTDYSCFLAMTRSPQNFAGTIELVRDKVQGLLVYHKTLPPSDALANRSEILEARLAIIEKLIELTDV